jgi:hypothetical protein
MFYFSIILGRIPPTDELRGVGLNHQPAIIYTYMYIFPTECESNDNSCWDVINVDGDVTPVFFIPLSASTYHRKNVFNTQLLSGNLI